LTEPNYARCLFEKLHPEELKKQDPLRWQDRGFATAG
jgi:hypothetical protein